MDFDPKAPVWVKWFEDVKPDPKYAVDENAPKRVRRIGVIQGYVPVTKMFRTGGLETEIHAVVLEAERPIIHALPLFSSFEVLRPAPNGRE